MRRNKIMTSKIMSISIPEELHRHVQNRVSGDSYYSISEYFRELIRIDVRMMQRAQNAQPAPQPLRARPQPVIERAQHAQSASPPQPARPQSVIERAHHAQPARPQPVIERPRLASAARRPPLSDRDIESLLRH